MLLLLRRQRQRLRLGDRGRRHKGCAARLLLVVLLGLSQR